MLLYVDDDPYAKWSMIGSLVSAGATLLGVALAGLGGLVAYRLFRVEADRDRREEARQLKADAFLRRQQASAIGFWRTGNKSWVLANLSQLPIYDLYVGTCTRATAKSATEVREITAANFGSTTLDDPDFPGYLAPGKSVALRIESNIPEGYFVNWSPASAVFTDNAGITWIRDRNSLGEVADLNPGERDLLTAAMVKATMLGQERFRARRDKD